MDDIAQPTLQAHQLVRRTIALVLAGGRGSRLKQLTDRRAKPAVYFGGKFRIIDFALSNCLNSGIRRMAVVTQYKSHSLMRHLQRGWSFLRARAQRVGRRAAGAAARRRRALVPRHGRCGLPEPRHHPDRSTPHDYIVVLAGDHIYKMDYSIMLTDHVAQRRAAARSAASRCRAWRPTAFGVMAIDARPQDHRLRREAGRPARHARQARLRAGQHGHLRLQRRLPVRAARGRQRQPRLGPRLRQGHHPAARSPRAGRWRIRSACRASPSPPRHRAGLLARRRHDRCVLGRQPRPGLDHPRSSTCTTPTGRSGPTSEQLPPAKFVLDARRQARHRRSTPSSRAAASSRARTVTQLGAVLRRARAFVLRRSTRRCCCRTSRSAAAAG